MAAQQPETYSDTGFGKAKRFVGDGEKLPADAIDRAPLASTLPGEDALPKGKDPKPFGGLKDVQG